MVRGTPPAYSGEWCNFYRLFFEHLLRAVEAEQTYKRIVQRTADKDRFFATGHLQEAQERSPSSTPGPRSHDTFGPQFHAPGEKKGHRRRQAHLPRLAAGCPGTATKMKLKLFVVGRISVTSFIIASKSGSGFFTGEADDESDEFKCSGALHAGGRSIGFVFEAKVAAASFAARIRSKNHVRRR
ncbi:hypothetical protein FQR65_LT20966 [Abscondita terminalis]|nr:hypothetical protein FQR65_LT20966 [Abscondita terminalis]